MASMLEIRVQNLESRLDSLMESFVQSQINETPIIEKTDESFAKCPQVDENTAGVAENDSAICDVAELADVNSEAIDDLAEIIDELETRVSELEG